MRTLYISQEIAPELVVGGLGLTAAALPRALTLDHGLQHTVVVPYFTRLLQDVQADAELVATFGHRRVNDVSTEFTVHRLLNHGHPFQVLFIRRDHWFGSLPSVYHDEPLGEHPHAIHRAGFFGACVARLALSGDYALVHANDWQSAGAVYHLARRRRAGELQGPASYTTSTTENTPARWAPGLRS